MTNEECTICFNILILQLLTCDHKLCLECFQSIGKHSYSYSRWLPSNGIKCPFCRKQTRLKNSEHNEMTNYTTGVLSNTPVVLSNEERIRNEERISNARDVISAVLNNIRRNNLRVINSIDNTQLLSNMLEDEAMLNAILRQEPTQTQIIIDETVNTIPVVIHRQNIKFDVFSIIVIPVLYYIINVIVILIKAQSSFSTCFMTTCLSIVYFTLLVYLLLNIFWMFNGDSDTSYFSFILYYYLFMLLGFTIGILLDLHFKDVPLSFKMVGINVLPNLYSIFKLVSLRISR